MDTYIAIFDNLTAKFLMESGIFSAQCPKEQEKFRVDFSLKIILWRLRMQFWQPCQKVSSNQVEIFCSMPKSVQENNFPVTKHLFHKRSLGTRWTKFWQLYRNSETKGLYFNAQGPETKKKVFIKMFLRNDPLDT